MSGTGTILAGPCGLKDCCQKPQNSCQACYKCYCCGIGLHARFCGTVIECNGDVMIECLPDFGCNEKKRPAAAEAMTSEDSINDEESDVLVVDIISPTVPAEATVATLLMLSATTGSKHEPRGWPSGSVAMYIKCPNKPGLPTKVPYDQSCCFCGNKRRAATFPATHWATHIFNCNAAPIEVRIAIGKQCKGKDVNDKLMNELVCQKNSQDITNVPCFGPTGMIPLPKRHMVLKNTTHVLRLL